VWRDDHRDRAIIDGERDRVVEEVAAKSPFSAAVAGNPSDLSSYLWSVGFLELVRDFDDRPVSRRERDGREAEDEPQSLFRSGSSAKTVTIGSSSWSMQLRSQSFAPRAASNGSGSNASNASARLRGRPLSTVSRVSRSIRIRVPISGAALLKMPPVTPPGPTDFGEPRLDRSKPTETYEPRMYEFDRTSLTRLSMSQDKPSELSGGRAPLPALRLAKIRCAASAPAGLRQLPSLCFADGQLAASCFSHRGWSA